MPGPPEITPDTFAPRRQSERGAAAAARSPVAAATPSPRTTATRRATKAYEKDGTEWYKADAEIMEGPNAGQLDPGQCVTYDDLETEIAPFVEAYPHFRCDRDRYVAPFCPS